MISLFMARSTWLHRCRAGHKLLALFAFSLILLPLTGLLPVAAAALGVSALYYSIGLGWRRQLALLVPVLPLIAALALLHLLSGSLLAGMVVLLRLLTLFMLANLVSMTTRMTDMMAAMMPALRPFALIGVPPRQIALAVALMLRFVPVFMAILDGLSEAWRARSAQRPRWRLMAPFLLQALATADSVAEALQARGGSAGVALNNDDRSPGFAKSG
ncbi:energy-coupling factor transporter transmembrane component T [Granulosicoccaceae sp. 1_MG-2023]|nr:energy-coupling factor transporter transmembrane component T [Granulosicoccaceae sp. 1_MG-2023]